MRACPSCAAEIDDDRPSGLCPQCLLTQALGDPAETVRRERVSQCNKCQSTLGENARFCAECGAPAQAAALTGDPIRTALEVKLAGHYRIIRLLGRGGMGAVYLARDLTLEREVAVKVVKSMSGAQETYERFRREARTAAKLSHPNIVPLHTFGEVEGMPYFVMGYVRGESLAARLQRDGRMTEAEGLRVLAQIADALEHAHRQGVVHRDIKPENVLIEDESGRALLTDFGVSKALGRGDTMTISGSIVGTPHYMSPEQASGHVDVDGRSDIYSLGVLGYVLLSGRLPFEGSSAADVLMKHMTQEPPSLRSLSANISHGAAQAIERCLAKERSDRWPDARTLKLALGATEDGQLPDALHAVEGRGVPGLAVASAAIVGMWFVGRAERWWFPGDDLGFWSSQLLTVAAVYGFVLMRMRQQGFTIAQSQMAIWREPSWWLWWYPKALRRRGNVWGRLPGEVRALRVLFPLIWIVLPLFIMGGTYLLESVAELRFDSTSPAATSDVVNQSCPN